MERTRILDTAGRLKSRKARVKAAYFFSRRDRKVRFLLLGVSALELINVLNIHTNVKPPYQATSLIHFHEHLHFLSVYSLARAGRRNVTIMPRSSAVA
jgi:hypothetical protein